MNQEREENKETRKPSRGGRIVKQLFSALVFFLIFILLFGGFTVVMRYEDGSAFAGSKLQYATLQNFKKDSVDVVFVGASAFHRGVLAPELYRDYGITSLVLGISSQRAYVMKPMLDQVLQYQTPKLVVLSTRVFSDTLGEPDGRAGVPLAAELKANPDNMPYGPQRQAMIKALLENYEVNDQKDMQAEQKAGNLQEQNGKLVYKGVDDINLQLDLLRNHNNWQDLSAPYFQALDPAYAALGNCYPITNIYKTKHTRPTNKVGSCDLSKSTYLMAILAELQQKHIPCLLVDCPALSSQSLASLEHPMQGVKTLSFRADSAKTAALTGIDYQTDFYNIRHMNYAGAMKFTKYLGGWLQRTYALPDHRGDAYFDGLLSTYDKQFKPGFDQKMAASLKKYQAKAS